MTEREWLRKAFERRQQYRAEGDRLFLSAWSTLVGSFETHLNEYKAVDKSSRLELRVDNDKMTIGDVTVRRCGPIDRSRCPAWVQAWSVFPYRSTVLR
jgi:hypothetical protein